jgi:hypothetical protein
LLEPIEDGYQSIMTAIMPAEFGHSDTDLDRSDFIHSPSQAVRPCVFLFLHFVPIALKTSLNYLQRLTAFSLWRLYAMLSVSSPGSSNMVWRDGNSSVCGLEIRREILFDWSEKR